MASPSEEKNVKSKIPMTNLHYNILYGAGVFLIFNVILKCTNI